MTQLCIIIGNDSITKVVEQHIRNCHPEWIIICDDPNRELNAFEKLTDAEKLQNLSILDPFKLTEPAMCEIVYPYGKRNRRKNEFLFRRLQIIQRSNML